MIKLSMILTVMLSASLAMAINGKGVFYKSPNCTCCTGYANALREDGFDFTVISDDELLYAQKEKLKVPENMYSCHTITLNGYIFEGHVPIEVIKRVLKDKPEIYGISTPGMPRFTEGMAGRRLDEVVPVYRFSKNNKYQKIDDFNFINAGSFAHFKFEKNGDYIILKK